MENSSIWVNHNLELWWSDLNGMIRDCLFTENKCFSLEKMKEIHSFPVMTLKHKYQQIIEFKCESSLVVSRMSWLFNIAYACGVNSWTQIM